MEIRFRFSRGEELKFIGHLDILRLFERAFKRAGIQVAHSEGFNPRPRIVFAQPMPLGLTSEGEFADVELAEQIDIANFIIRCNKVIFANPDSAASAFIAFVKSYHINHNLPFKHNI